MKIVSLTAENVKRLKAVEITPERVSDPSETAVVIEDGEVA